MEDIDAFYRCDEFVDLHRCCRLGLDDVNMSIDEKITHFIKMLEFDIKFLTDYPQYLTRTKYVMLEDADIFFDRLKKENIKKELVDELTIQIELLKETAKKSL